MGISRSATVVCAYLIASAKITPDEALIALKAKRACVCPNLGFRQQLVQYANLQGIQSCASRAFLGPVLRLASRRPRGAIRKLTGMAQQKPNTGNSSSTLPISGVASSAELIAPPTIPSTSDHLVE